MNRKWIGLGILGLLVGLIVLLIWPVANSAFKIKVDEDKKQGKSDFLSNYQNLPPLQKKLPNIILILADDLGKTDVSAYGGNWAKTPNIDRLGAEGIRFTDGYITSPICSPSRAGILTGRYQQRFGFELNIHERYPRNRMEYFWFKHIMDTGDWLVREDIVAPPNKEMLKQGLPSSEITLAEFLKLRNYRTGMVGKWHLGYNENAIPNNRGFDYHYGFLEAFSLYADTSGEGIVNQRLAFDFSDKHIWGKAREGNCAIRRNGEVVEESEYLTDKIAEEAVDYMRRQGDKPFFLYVPFSAPHTPFQVTKEYYEQFSHIKDPYRRMYNAMVAALDNGVGTIMKGLRDLGLEENTLVIFLSDNGGATYTRGTDNAPLSGGKFTHFEGGLNVPFMMSWPGKIPEGQLVTQPVSALDIFPTIANLAQIPLPGDRKYDGVDLMALASDGQALSTAGEGAIDSDRKLFWRSGYNFAIRSGKWKLIQDQKAGITVLYDLEKDKSEQFNLASKHPDIVESLLKEITEWEGGLIPAAWPNVMDFRYYHGDSAFYFPL